MEAEQISQLQRQYLGVNTLLLAQTCLELCARDCGALGCPSVEVEVSVVGHLHIHSIMHTVYNNHKVQVGFTSFGDLQRTSGVQALLNATLVSHSCGLHDALILLRCLSLHFLCLEIEEHGWNLHPQTIIHSKCTDGTLLYTSFSPPSQNWLWTQIANPSLEKCTKLHRGSKRSQLTECVGRATCLLARRRHTSFELPTSRLRKSSSIL